MTKPTQDQIKEQIALLKKDRETYTVFGYLSDPNWKIIDAQIQILEEDLDHGDIDNMLNDESEYFIDGIDDEDLMIIRQARDWMDGVSNPPTEG